MRHFIINAYLMGPLNRFLQGRNAGAFLLKRERMGSILNLCNFSIKVIDPYGSQNHSTLTNALMKLTCLFHICSVCVYICVPVSLDIKILYLSCTGKKVRDQLALGSASKV
jgi:hypothetical protein